MAGSTSSARRRDGAATRQEALGTALRLFTEQGYDATSLRQIAEVLGINKASLYYHFPSKEAILRAVVEQRGDEARQLLAWCEQQPRTTALIRETVLRWIDSSPEEKLRGIRLLRANPFIGRLLAPSGADRIGDPLGRVAALLVELLPDPAPERAMLIRMALLSLGSAVEAASGADLADDALVGAARAAASELVDLALRP